MSSTRPIPISNRSRASPPTSSSSRGASPPSALDLGISQSCPIHAQNGHVPIGSATSSRSRFQPPRAPFFGSLPEPSFLQIDDDAMPELLLPPPAQHRNSSPAAPSVVQFASSCPVDIGFMRQGHPTQHSWTPSPRALDEFDLSKSPALAIMSAAREGRMPLHNFRRVGQQQQPPMSPHSSRHRPPMGANEASTAGDLYTDLMGRMSIAEEEQQSFSDDSADYSHETQQPYSGRRLAAADGHDGDSDAYDRRDRRSSYGSLSDTGDAAGVFDFEES